MLYKLLIMVCLFFIDLMIIGKLDVLVVSDSIAKLGVISKFPHIEHVIMWDIPFTIQDFVKRTGFSKVQISNIYIH